MHTYIHTCGYTYIHYTSSGASAEALHGVMIWFLAFWGGKRIGGNMLVGLIGNRQGRFRHRKGSKSQPYAQHVTVGVNVVWCG